MPVLRISHEKIRRQEYALTHNWHILIPVPAIIPSNIFSGGFKVQSLPSVLNLNCESTEVPSYDVTMMEIIVNGTTTRQPSVGKVNSPLPLIFYEDADHFLSRFFEAWKKLGGDTLNSSQVLRSICRIPRGLIMTLLTGQGTPSAIYELQYFYPGSVRLDPLTGNAGIQKLSVAMNYDNFERVL